MPSNRPRLLDQVRHVLRVKHYSIRTEQAYVQWIKRFILFHNKQHPTTMDTPEVEAFLTHLAVVDKVAPSTQNQALAAILFLYHHVLKQPLTASVDAVRAKNPQHLPVVMSQKEIQCLFEHLDSPYALMAQLLYGCGLRLMECIRLRVKILILTNARLLSATAKETKTESLSYPILQLIR